VRRVFSGQKHAEFCQLELVSGLSPYGLSAVDNCRHPFGKLSPVQGGPAFASRRRDLAFTAPE
jgi:hypothetical protein